MKQLDEYSSDIFYAIELCNTRWLRTIEFQNLCNSIRFYKGGEIL